MAKRNLDVLGVLGVGVLGVGQHVASLGESHHVPALPCLLACYVSFNCQPREELGERHPTDASGSIAAFSARRGGGEVALPGRERQCVDTLRHRVRHRPRAPSGSRRVPTHACGVASCTPHHAMIASCMLIRSFRPEHDCVLHARVRSLRWQAVTWSLEAGKDQGHH